MIAHWLISRYPRAWRDRYADELHDWIREGGDGPRVLWDLVRGLVDAWLHTRLPEPGYRALGGLGTVGAGYVAFLLAGAGAQKLAEDPRFGHAARLDPWCQAAWQVLRAAGIASAVAILAVLAVVALTVLPQAEARRPLRRLAAATTAIGAATAGIAAYPTMAVGLAGLAVMLAALGFGVRQVAGAVRASRPSASQIRLAAGIGTVAAALMAAVTAAGLLWTLRLAAVDPTLMPAADGLVRTTTAVNLVAVVAVCATATVRVATWSIPRLTAN